jgi:hypothetical protein
MEYWSIGVRRCARIAPCVRGVGGTERAEDFRSVFRSVIHDLVTTLPPRWGGTFFGWNPGLKPG